MTERRTARRYDLSLPVSVRLPINREPGAHDGQTRDISTRGVYFTMITLAFTSDMGGCDPGPGIGSPGHACVPPSMS